MFSSCFKGQKYIILMNKPKSGQGKAAAGDTSMGIACPLLVSNQVMHIAWRVYQNKNEHGLSRFNRLSRMRILLISNGILDKISV